METIEDVILYIVCGTPKFTFIVRFVKDCSFLVGAQPALHYPASLPFYLPRLPLGRQRGNNALPGQPQELRLFVGINANLSCVLLDL